MTIEQDSWLGVDERLDDELVSDDPLSEDLSELKRRASTSTGVGDRRVQMNIRVSKEDKQRAAYWAEKRGFASANEYIAEALAEKIRRENQDYDLPTLEIARLNQLLDEVKALSLNMANLERVQVRGFDSLIGMTRGDSYLMDDEDGEL